MPFTRHTTPTLMLLSSLHLLRIFARRVCITHNHFICVLCLTPDACLCYAETAEHLDNTCSVTCRILRGLTTSVILCMRRFRGREQKRKVNR
ncbi:hypothetical protein B0T12DRAFT_422214 [Alternaria alternata]|nr:hypothetical protein B0T12DRAFT_422214 [Alternaria alternata]